MEEILKMVDECQDVFVSSPDGNFKLPLKEYLENQVNFEIPSIDQARKKAFGLNNVRHVIFNHNIFH